MSYGKRKAKSPDNFDQLLLLDSLSERDDFRRSVEMPTNRVVETLGISDVVDDFATWRESVEDPFAFTPTSPSAPRTKPTTLTRKPVKSQENKMRGARKRNLTKKSNSRLLLDLLKGISSPSLKRIQRETWKGYQMLCSLNFRILD